MHACDMSVFALLHVTTHRRRSGVDDCVVTCATSQLTFIDSCNLHEVPQQTDFERTIPMYGHREPSRVSRFTVNVMTSFHSP